MDVEQPEGEGFDATRMPTKTEFSYVSIQDYDEDSKSFSHKYTINSENYSRYMYHRDLPTIDDALTSDFSKAQTNVTKTPTGALLTLNLSQVNATPTNDPADSSSDNSSNETGEEQEKKSAGFKHDLPAPQAGTLDAAIEKATRAAVRGIRDYLESFSQNTAEHFLQ